MRNGEGGMRGHVLRFIRLHTIAVLLIFLLLFAAGDTFAQSRAEAGRTLARQWCSSCHLVEMGGNARDTAPSFSALAQQRGGDLNWIRTRMQVPLYPMQGINLSRGQIDDIVAYFESLRAEASASRLH